MGASRRLVAFFSIALFAVGPSAFAQQSRQLTDETKPTESEHTKGPHGIEGWTLNSPVPESNHGNQRFAFILVLARNGHLIHRVQGDPIIWNWMFWSDGRQVAYETGPFHFSMSCVLIDTKSGRRVDTIDCWQELPADAPDWAKALEKQR